MVKVSAEVVNGECPTCSEITMLVGLTPELFRCMNCGADLQQHVNGKMARKFKSFETRDKPKKRGPRKHKKSLNKNEKRQKRTRRYKGQGKG